MTSPHVWHAVQLPAWGAGTNLAVGASSTAAQDLSGTNGANIGRYVLIQAAGTAGERIHIRWGGSSVGASTTADIFLNVGDIAKVRIRPEYTHFRAIASAAAQALKYVVLDD